MTRIVSTSPNTQAESNPYFGFFAMGVLGTDENFFSSIGER